MKLPDSVKAIVKTLLTLAIFVGIFAELGGGPVEVDRAALVEGTLWQQPNPAMPGLVGKIKARLSGATLPEPRVALPAGQVCKAAAGGTVFATAKDGRVVPVRALRHCRDDRLATAFGSDDEDDVVELAQVGERAWLRGQGFQLVPMDARELWREVTSVKASTFVPWFLFAMLVKLVGIFVNVYRWQILLRGQGLDFPYRWLVSSYFVGRYFGIVTPGTLGLDGWRLYDTTRASGKPVEATTALAVERVVGLVGLLAVILMFMPFADLDGRDLADVVKAMALPIAAAMACGVLLLLRPAAFQGLVRFLPSAKVRGFVERAITSATAYSSRRGALLVALGCAIFGQLTTMAMYFGNAMALGVEGVTATQVLYASAVMTLGTFLAPSASGEGVRELVFVWLLGGHTTAAKAFLIGHLGFWIEKLPLSLPGLWPLLRAPESYKRVTAEDLAALQANAGATRPAAGE
jgi:hypothetical protein